MNLKIPKDKQNMSLCRLLSLFKQSANDVGLSHQTHRSRDRSLDLASSSYLFPCSLRVFKQGRFFRSDLAKYNYFNGHSHYDIDRPITGNILKYHGIELDIPKHFFEDSKTVEPSFSSVAGIQNQDLRNFVGWFYDLLLGENRK